MDDKQNNLKKIPSNNNDIELIENTKIPCTDEKLRLRDTVIDIEVSFCTHVGWNGILNLLFALLNAILFTYVTFLYTKNFQSWNRPRVWLFVIFALFYLLLILKFLCTWKKLAQNFSEAEQKHAVENPVLEVTDDTVLEVTDDTVESIDRIIEHRQRGNSLKNSVHRAKAVAKNAQNIYEKLQINGPWFLWTLYFSEIFESAQQCANLVTIYLCSLPVGWTTCICLGLAIDCMHCAYNMIHKNTPARRDTQVKLDTLVDFLCASIPLCVMWFGYNVPISMSEMTSITLLPTFFMLCKLDDILQEGVHRRAAAHIMKQREIHSRKLKRRRDSLFIQIAHLKVAQEQENKIPRAVKLLACMLKTLFAVFFFTVGISHLFMYPSNCDKKIFKMGCVNKISFCNSLFTPTCNCASLHIENDHTLTNLPNNLADEMTGLRNVFIRNCNLTQLPPRMEQLTEMVAFEVSFNQLQSFDVDVGKWEKLNKLYLDYNNIIRNHKSLWIHKEIAALAVANNSFEVPMSEIYMPSLNFLYLGDNNITISSTISSKQFPNLLDLYLCGNNIIQFPDESLKHTLSYLSVSRCNLKSLPLYLSKFQSLVYFDARDNNIVEIDDGLKTLLKNNDAESYFSNNPVCKNDKSLDCEPLCSKTCWSRKVSNDGFCDVMCNTEECKYDGGDC